jgi:hypothetical protein
MDSVEEVLHQDDSKRKIIIVAAGLNFSELGSATKVTEHLPSHSTKNNKVKMSLPELSLNPSGLLHQ